MKVILFFLFIIPFNVLAQANLKRTTQSNIILHEPPIVVNNYAEVTALDICKNEISILDASAFNANDTVLIIQMKGVDIDTSNTANFGQITNYHNAGNYELNIVLSKVGNVLKLKYTTQRRYDIPNGLVQLVRVPYAEYASYDGEYVCDSWDGKKGGVLVLSARKIELQTHINVTGRGFTYGKYESGLSSATCSENNYNYTLPNKNAAFKGEGITTLSTNLLKGKGSPANAGGGGLSNNSGGGGGANAGSGGFGGYQSDTCGNAPFDNRGIGGHSLSYSTIANKIFMGGGGGSGHAQNENSGAYFANSRGGGIAIIIADTLISFGAKLMANGGDAIECVSGMCDDGMYGGGGGGSVILSVNKFLDNVIVETKGGKGADVISNILPAGRLGPGGGGGGGTLFINSATMPLNVTSINIGGTNGVITTDGNNPWGATSGSNGANLFNLPNLFPTIIFKPNIDSVRINPSLITCNSFNFNGLAFTNTNPIQFWQWNFGDNTFSSNQNETHIYSSENTFNVKLIATDVNGCKDSTNTSVISKIVTVDAGKNKTICSNGVIATTLFGNGAGVGTYSWTPINKVDDSNAQNPIATIDKTTKFFLSYTSNACIAKDSVEIFIYPIPVLSIAKSNEVNCVLPYTKLSVSGAIKYLWTPSETLNSSINQNVLANPITTTKYYVSGTNDNICFGKDSILVIADFSKNNMQLPNSFTPNNDGINDCFGLNYYRGVQNFSFIIFNRYGEVVFNTTNHYECWNGKYKGQPADPANYIYFLKCTLPCGKVVKKGNILLLR